MAEPKSQAEIMDEIEAEIIARRQRDIREAHCETHGPYASRRYWVNDHTEERWTGCEHCAADAKRSES